jgi:hypothetical protein
MAKIDAAYQIGLINIAFKIVEVGGLSKLTMKYLDSVAPRSPSLA